MPPNQGPFPGVVNGPPPGGIPVGAVHVNDWNDSPFPEDRGGSRDVWDDYDDQDIVPQKNKNKNKGNKKEDKTPVELKYEGYMLEKAEPKRGEKYSWARIGKRALPFDDPKLVAIIKEHRKRTRKSPQHDFSQLTSNQAGVIDRLIADRKLYEKNKNADWVLADVQKFGKYHWTTVDVKKIQVILKRIDKNQIKSGEHTTKGSSKSYQWTEIIDLAEPLERKKNDNNKDGKKGKKKSQSVEDLTLLDGDPLGLGLGPPPQRHDNHNHNQQHQQFAQPMMPPPPPVPGAIPVDPHGPFPPGPPPMQHPHPSARHPLQGHPFQPHDQFAAPGQFDPPPMHDHDYPHPQDRNRSRSNSGPNRRPSARRPSAGPRRYSQMEDYDLNEKLDRWGFHNDSSEGSYEDDDVFSPPLSELRDFSPPSSPRSQFSEGMARGSLERRKSYGRDLRYHPKYRSHKYRDVEIEPEYSYRSGDRRYSRDSRRNSRPGLSRIVTYDDYPNGKAAEPRYLPPPPRPQRRLTDYADDRYDYDDYDDFPPRRDGRDSRRRSVVDSEMYEPRRRDTWDGGRQRFMSSGGGGYHR